MGITADVSLYRISCRSHCVNAGFMVVLYGGFIMSWQGTVIKKHKYAEAQYMGDRFLQILSEQAEISYKAGAKEERERIEGEAFIANSLCMKCGKTHKMFVWGGCQALKGETQ